jgi:small subunit ribosomal protein S20
VVGWGAPPDAAESVVSMGVAPDALAGFATIVRARGTAGFLQMPNIKQQKKRVRLAAEQRLENLRYRSTAKTLAKRLRDAAGEGDSARVDAEYRKLVSWLDRAASRGAIHKNAAARRKAQAEKLRSGSAS